MALYGSNFWKKIPFVKLLLAMMASILVQWHFQIGVKNWWLILLISFIAVISFFFVPFFNRYKLAFVTGIFTGILFFSVGALLAWEKDIRNNKQWLGNFYKEKDALVVTLDETLVEKDGVYVFSQDTEFSSPSAAAAVIAAPTSRALRPSRRPKSTCLCPRCSDDADTQR